MNIPDFAYLGNQNSKKTSTKYTSESQLIRCKKGIPCPICDHTDWCSVADNGAFAICMRVADGAIKDSLNGGYVHILNAHVSSYSPCPTNRPAPTAQPSNPCASIVRRHAVYTAWLNHLSLNNRHLSDLSRRGLSSAFIADNSFASVPTADESARIVDDLASEYDLTGVPGFFREDEAWRAATWSRGYFIPVRDLAGRIQALRVRRDESDNSRYIWFSSKDKPDGASSGSPMHFAGRHYLSSGEAIVTEGELKAEVIAAHLNCAVISLPGVKSWNQNFADALVSIGIKRTRIAFDADWRKTKEVFEALRALIVLLESQSIDVSVIEWDASQGKGLDDYLTKAVTNE